MHRHLVIRNQRGLFEHQILNVEAKEAYAAYVMRLGDNLVGDTPLAADEEEAFANGKLRIPSAGDTVTKVWIAA